MTNDEITAVLGHEIGHDKLHHTIVMLIWAVACSFVQYFFLGKMITSHFLAEAFFLEDPTVYSGLLLFFLVWGVVEFFVGIPMTINSRRNEYAADRFSIEAGKDNAKDLSNGLKKLMTNSKSNLTPHPFHVFLHDSHPAMFERLKAIEAHQKKIWG